MNARLHECPQCDGTGRKNRSEVCSACNGSGHYQHSSEMLCSYCGVDLSNGEKHTGRCPNNSNHPANQRPVKD